MDDLVEGVVRLMKNEETHPVNLGNAVEHTVREVADMVPKLSGGELTHEPLPADDPRRRRPDITRARESLGWEPKVLGRKGLEKTIARFRER